MTTICRCCCRMSNHAGRRLKSKKSIYALTFLTWLLMIRLRCFLSSVALNRSTVKETISEESANTDKHVPTLKRKKGSLTIRHFAA